MNDLIAKNLLSDKICFNCKHFCFEDSERIDIEYCARNNNYMPLMEQKTCTYWEENIYFNKTIKYLPFKHSCINCYNNNDWEHSHNGSEVIECALPNHHINRKNGVCENWKKI